MGHLWDDIIYKYIKKYYYFLILVKQRQRGVREIVVANRNTNGIGYWHTTLQMIALEFLWIGSFFLHAVCVDVILSC